MKKVFIVAAMAAALVSCGSKSNKNAALMAETETDSIFFLNDSTLADYQTFTYEGILPAADAASGINYLLSLNEVAEDSVGTYELVMTYLDTPEGDQTYNDNGTVVTLIGIPNDSTAVVYQLVSATPEKGRLNFLAEGDSALTLIGRDFKKAVSKLNYTLKKKL